MTTQAAPLDDDSLTGDPVQPSGPVAVSDPPPTEELPRLVADGRYRLERLVARGGMGSVYLATQMALQRQVALKLMYGRTADDSRTRRFMLEASVLAKLQHRNIVTVFDHGEAEGALFMAMEYIEGDTLADRLDRNGAFPLGKALRIADQIGRALRVAHKHAVAHRDLKPSNVMLTRDGDDQHEDVKVLDFGLVKVYSKKEESGTDRDLTEAETMLGSPRYMAPEQILSASVDARTDIYSYGILLYAMLTGKAPFDGGKVAILQAHLQRDLPPLGDLGPDISSRVSEGVAALLQRCTRKNPEERYQTIEEVLVDLHKIPFDELDWSSSTASRIVNLPGAEAARARTRKKQVAGALAAAAVLAGLMWALPEAPQEETHKGTAQPPAVAATAVEARAPAQPEQPAAHRLRIVTSPDRVSVFLDGRELGTTPIETSLLPGEHSFLLRKDGFAGQELKVKVDADTPATFERRAELTAVDATPLASAPERRRHARGTPARSDSHAAPALADKPQAPAANPDCASPYYVDANGIKRIKATCLGDE